MTDEILERLKTIPDAEIENFLTGIGGLQFNFLTENGSEVEVNTDVCGIVEAKSSISGAIRIKVMSPGQGSSGYYPTEVVKRDLPNIIKPGLQMFWDHPGKNESREAGGRSLDRLAGKFVSEATWEDHPIHGPGAYADIVPLNGYGPRVKELAKHNAFGVSLLGSGVTRAGQVAGKATQIFEKLLHAHSVDFVTAAGRGGKVVEMFEAAVTGGGGDTWDEAPKIKEKEKKKKMEIDDAEYTRLKESASKVTGLEESNKTLATSLLRIEAKSMVTEALATSGIKKTAHPKVVAELMAKVPVKEGSLDVEVFEASIKTAVTEWLAIAGAEKAPASGNVTDMGLPSIGTAVMDMTESDVKMKSGLERLTGRKAS